MDKTAPQVTAVSAPSPVPVLGPNLFDSSRLRVAIILMLAFLLVLPIWLVKYPPLVDYPDHLARAFVLHHLNDPNYDFGRWYASDWGPNPYLLADLLMQLFQSAVGIYAAGHLMLTLCVLGLPLATLFFLRRANPGNDYLALWAFAVAYNPDFLMGFMSFVLSIALCFLTVGVWLDYLRTGKIATWFLTLLLATLTFLTHLGGFGIAAIAITLYTLATRGFSRSLFMAVLPFVPGCSFFLYAKLHGWAGRGLDYSTWHVVSKFRSMLVPFRGYSQSVELLTLAAVAATVIYFLLRRNKLKIQYAWILVALAILAVHWIVPDQYGDLAFIDYRFPIFAFLFLLAAPSFTGPRNSIALLAIAIFLIHTFHVGIHFLSEQKRLTDLARNFQYIPPKALVLAYSAKGDRFWLDSSNLHFWAYGVIDQGWISPSLFHQKSVQPLQLRVFMCADDDQYGDKLIRREYDAESIAQRYDYVWASNVGYLDPFLTQVGEPVLSQGEVEIYRSKRTMPHSAWDITPSRTLQPTFTVTAQPGQ